MTTKQLLKFINECAPLQSLLYDLDLLPEMLKQRSRDWYKMKNIAEHFKIATTPRDL